MRAIDINCEHLGLFPVQLMENAGAIIAQNIREKMECGKVFFVAGLGNNGGDAFVAGRHLAGFSGYTIKFILLGKAHDIKTRESCHNFSRLKFNRLQVLEIKDSSQLTSAASDWFSEADLLVDAIFGTGVKKAGKTVISVDIPSGVDPDGCYFKKPVHAKLTVTIHRMKIGLISEKAKGYTGTIKDCRYRNLCGRRTICGLWRPNDTAQAKFWRAQRKFWKDSCNRRRSLLRSPGSCSFCSFEGGADIVTVAIPEPISKIIESYSPNLIVRKLSSNLLCPNDLSILTDLINSHDIVVLGMGLGRASETLEAIRKILPFCRKTVLDADALSALSCTTFEALAGKCELIVTPHAEEFTSLSDIETPENQEGRIKAVKEFSEEKGIVTLLKGKIDVISDGKKPSWTEPETRAWQ
jgi:hydroxyethylthiazole kinase-like uncharacterized protein yjeF